MNLYAIRDWDTIYENNRTRELKTLAWVPIPNNHDSDGYTLLLSHKNGAALFGAWIACVQVASRCDPRGTLLRRSGIPHDAASLSRITRIEQAVIEQMLSIADRELKWLVCNDLRVDAGIPQEGATIPQEGALNRTEQNGTEIPPLPPLGGNGQGELIQAPPQLDPTRKRLNALFNRRDTTRWSPREEKALKSIGHIEEEDLRILEEYYSADIPKDKDWRRHDILTLLNNFPGEVDRARNYRPASCL